LAASGYSAWKASAATPAIARGSVSAKIPLASEYQAVLLSNGQIMFGKLEGLGSAYPVLRDVYYVARRPASAEPAPSADSQSSLVLVQRGQEWHGPDRMILNASQILVVEPVGADSRVARLIAESKQKTR
jgi:hypothetical protein